MAHNFKNGHFHIRPGNSTWQYCMIRIPYTGLFSNLKKMKLDHFKISIFMMCFDCENVIFMNILSSCLKKRWMDILKLAYWCSDPFMCIMLSINLYCSAISRHVYVFWLWKTIWNFINNKICLFILKHKNWGFLNIFSLMLTQIEWFKLLQNF